ncbi:hypothetical protein GWI33_003071 [Rhynchophorus ferrugineus]|uniref:Uncharacterized protein n=1 Tax=Rhynchophorus ferrugineus TaxID=354439 RepID=A0A834ILT1_RHYFE|nr:hypothetical protein GWI33_003071 [Rhynchophorus ferrugineus]
MPVGNQSNGSLIPLSSHTPSFNVAKVYSSNEHDIDIIPPTNGNEDPIDDDSGDVRDVAIGSLSASQLLPEAEIVETQNEENQQNNERNGKQWEEIGQWDQY